MWTHLHRFVRHFILSITHSLWHVATSYPSNVSQQRVILPMSHDNKLSFQCLTTTSYPFNISRQRVINFSQTQYSYNEPTASSIYAAALCAAWTTKMRGIPRQKLSHLDASTCTRYTIWTSLFPLQSGEVKNRSNNKCGRCAALVPADFLANPLRIRQSVIHLSYFENGCHESSTDLLPLFNSGVCSATL